MPTQDIVSSIARDIIRTITACSGISVVISTYVVVTSTTANILKIDGTSCVQGQSDRIDATKFKGITSCSSIELAKPQVFCVCDGIYVVVTSAQINAVIG